MYTVKEVSAMLGLTAHTIRYYTDLGLIPMLKRDKNNHRLFDEEAVNWLTAVKTLRGCGMSIEAIKHYLDLCLDGDCSVPERYEIFMKQKEIVDAQLREIAEHAAFLERKLAHYQQIMNNAIPDDTNPVTWAPGKGIAVQVASSKANSGIRV